MTEIETLAKLFGIPGLLIGFGVWTVRTLAPIWHEHLKANSDSLKAIAASMGEMVRWQHTIDLRLERIERNTDESADNVRILFERIGEDMPKSPRAIRRRRAGSEAAHEQP